MSEEIIEIIERLDCFEPDDLVECAMYRDCVEKIKKFIEVQQKEIEEIRQWKYTIDTYEDLDKLKELDLIKIKGKKYIAENRLQEFKDLLLKELDRDFVTKEYRQAISCYFKKILEE